MTETTETTRLRGQDRELWLRRCCALIVAGVAAYGSYQHQRHFALHGGADPVSAALWPLSVDGLLLLATVGLLKSGHETSRRVRLAVWLSFLLGIAVSLAANIAAAPTLAWQSILVAGWPPVALLLAAELLTHHPQPREQTETQPALSKQDPDPETGNETEHAVTPRGVSKPAKSPAEQIMWEHFLRERARGAGRIGLSGCVSPINLRHGGAAPFLPALRGMTSLQRPNNRPKMPPAVSRSRPIAGCHRVGLRQPAATPAASNGLATVWRRLSATLGWSGWPKWAALLTALAAVAALWFSGQSLRATQNQIGLTEQGQLTDRFGKAVEQLGSGAIDVRLGGIYALERLAHDSFRDQATIVDLLAAFVRTHAPPASVCDSLEPASLAPKIDIQAALTAIGRRDPTRSDLGPIKLSKLCLRGAALAGASLARVDLSQTNLDDADFTSAQLQEANFHMAALRGASLNRANLQGASLRQANLASASVQGANFSTADLTQVNLNGTYENITAEFGVNSPEARDNVTYFNGSLLGSATIVNANLAGSDFSDAYLVGANLTDSDLSHCNFLGATMGGTVAVHTAGPTMNRARTNLTSANLRKANLTNVDLTEVVLSDTDLVDAIGVQR